MVWNNLSIPKLQRCNRWSLGMDKLFHTTVYNGCNYLSMLGLKLNHVSKSGQRDETVGHDKYWFSVKFLPHTAGSSMHFLCGPHMLYPENWVSFQQHNHHLEETELLCSTAYRALIPLVPIDQTVTTEFLKDKTRIWWIMKTCIMIQVAEQNVDT